MSFSVAVGPCPSVRTSYLRPEVVVVCLAASAARKWNWGMLRIEISSTSKTSVEPGGMPEIPCLCS
jgi:hypothetical protein